jgi:hypothetical protein
MKNWSAHAQQELESVRDEGESHFPFRSYKRIKNRSNYPTRHDFNLLVYQFTSMPEHSCYLFVSFRVNLLTKWNRFVIMRVLAVRFDVPQIMVSVRH